MAVFNFKAKNAEGKTISGTISAYNQELAISKLKETYAVVSSIKEKKKKEDFRDVLNIRKVKDKNLALVCEQFSIILKAGLPIVRTVTMIAEQTNDKYLKQVLMGVAEDVASGKNMADSFAARGPKLPITFIETIRAGEESGALDKSFDRLAEYLSNKAKIRSKVVAALTYPAFVVGVAIVVIAIIMIIAVPQFTAAFEATGTELPLPTRMVMAMSDFMTHWFWVIALIIIGAIAVDKWYESKPENKIKMDGYRLKMPVLGKIHLMNGCSQYANTLSTMIYAGLPAVRAMEITGKAMNNRNLGDAVSSAAEDVALGFAIGTSVKRKGVFPDLLTEMTTVGEETGSLENTMNIVGKYYDNEVEVVTTRATKLLEPTIICILAVFVVIILLAVYAPMFTMYDNVDKLA